MSAGRPQSRRSETVAKFGIVRWSMRHTCDVSDDQTASSSELRSLALRIRHPQNPLVRLTVRIVAGVVLLLGLVVLLGLVTKPSQKTPGSTNKVLTNSRPSIVEGFPVPIQASLTTPTAKTTAANYVVPSTVASLNSWYFQHLQIGKPWRNWNWVGESRTCNGHFTGFASVWQWERNGKVLTLTVSRSNGFTSLSIYTARLNALTTECAPT